MVSNRLIALALVATLLQAWILSFRLAAAAGDKAATPPRPWHKAPAEPDAPHCRRELAGLSWLAPDSSVVLQLTEPPAAADRH